MIIRRRLYIRDVSTNIKMETLRDKKIESHLYKKIFFFFYFLRKEIVIFKIIFNNSLYE